MHRVLIVALLLALSAVSAAQRCQEELHDTLQRLPQGTEPGVVAAELMARAVRLVEPALPPLVWTTRIPLEQTEPGFDAVRYLVERRLLPDDWRREGLSPEGWSEMLARFADWYDLPGPETTWAGDDPAAMVADLAELLQRVGEKIRPVLLVASDQEDPSGIAFLGLVWNWTVYPRLIVLRPDSDQSLNAGPRPLLDELSNCVVRLDHYVLAPEDTARTLFLANARARMYVIGSEPQLRNWPSLVPEGAEESYFAFRAEEVASLASFSAAFDGEGIGMGRLMAMLPRVRTNLPPYRIPGLFGVPPRN